MSSPRISLLVLRVSDLERAADFYRLLGFEFKKHAHGSGPEHYASETEGLVFELYPASAKRPVSSSVRMGFVVEDIDAMTVRLGGLTGAKVLSMPADSEWGRRAVVADPDGHRVELVASR